MATTARSLRCSRQCLDGLYADEQNLDGSEKVRRYRLATSIYGANGPLDVPAEDIAMCKKLISKGFRRWSPDRQSR